MADDSLKDPVVIRAIGINASSLPRGLNPAYEQYILSQVIDFTSVAGKANEAGQGAYEAQVKNDEQDVILGNHESRITQLRLEIDDHEIRISANTSAISTIDVRVTTVEGEIVALDSRVTGVESDIATLQSDYVSKSETTSQSISSPLDVTTSYSINGTKVIGSRQAGWTAATGTALLGAFNANQTYSASATYTQTDIIAIRDGLIQARQRIKALEDMARNHGLIN